jgi:hypothetical protein
MEAWRWFWSLFCGVGVVAFALLVVVVAPLGFRDLRRLLSTLEGRAGPAGDAGRKGT